MRSADGQQQKQLSAVDDCMRKHTHIHTSQHTVAACRQAATEDYMQKHAHCAMHTHGASGAHSTSIHADKKTEGRRSQRKGNTRQQKQPDCTVCMPDRNTDSRAHPAVMPIIHTPTK